MRSNAEKKKRIGRNIFTISLSLLTMLLCVFFVASRLNSSRAEKPDKLNLLLITVDTLRADWLSCYDREHVKTPNIDTLAEKGVLFLRAFANTSTTLPSHANILLGVSPLYHGVHENSNFVVREEFLTMSEHLKVNKYSTGAFVGAFPLEERFGLAQGFDIYDDDFERKRFQKVANVERKAEIVVDNAIDWLKGRESPWFLWVHCWDPHDPYEPPEPFKTQYAKNPYSGEVAYVDFVLKRLFVHLEENNLFDKTLVVLTGDHGESLGQHGEETHGFFAYNTTIWIPLIIVSPGMERRQVDHYVSHLDIFPTVCDVLGVKKPPFLQGISLLPALKGKKVPKKPIYFESLHPYYSKGWAPLRGYIHNMEKFIQAPIPELFDLKDDFDENNNLAERKKLDNQREQLEKIIKGQAYLESSRARERLDKESIEKLKSLGYISSSQDVRKESYGPNDDVKILLPYYYKAHEAVDRYEEGETREGFELLKEIIIERKDVDIAYINLANLYKRERRLSDAVQVLKIGHENITSSYLIFYVYVSYLLDARQYDEIIKMIGENSYRQMEFDPEIWNFFGIAYSKKGDFERAIEMYEYALPLDSESPALYTNLGEAQFSLTVKTKDTDVFKKSILSFQKALELDPDYPLAFNGLGKALRLAGEMNGAISALKKALELEPELDDALYFLGLTYLEKGDKDKALNTFNLYKKKYYYLLPASFKQKLDELIQKCKK